MPLLARKDVLLAKIESPYGSDPTPTGASNAILAYNINLTPLEQILVSREIVRPFIGNFEQLIAAGYQMLEFEVEIAGAGTGGSAPGYGPLLRACGLSQTLNAAAVTGTAQSGSASGIVLDASLSESDDTFNGMVIRITGGTGSGQRRLITDYVGSTDTATVNKAWDTAPDNTSTYSIDAAAFYAPVSTGFESVTIFFYKDGVLHEGNGVRGSVSFGINRLQRPTMRFRMLGLYVAATDSANPTPTLTGFQRPLPVNNTNTTAFTLHGAAAVLDNLSIDLANAVTYRHLVGSESIEITDRSTAGNVLIESVLVATKDWLGAVRAGTLDELTIKHGTAGGNTVYLDAPNVQLVNPRYSVQDGINMTAMDMMLLPAVSAGNDEIYLTVA